MERFGVRRGVLTVTVAAIALAVWAGAASAATGQLEICKAGDNGAAGQSFAFTYVKGAGTPAGVSVSGGSCSAPIPVAVGSYLIQEDLSRGQWTMQGASVVPAGAWVSENDRAGKVKVTISANAETQVTVTNTPAAATVKVCKWSASPALQGAQYSFTVNGQTVTAVAGKNAAGAGCSNALSTQPGTRLKIQESIPANEQVTGVTFNGAAATATAGLVRVTAATGANVVVFENEPVGPPQTGYVEICKDAADAYISTSVPFTFTISDRTGFSDTENVLAGQCSGPIKVAAGNVNVAETPTDGTVVSAITSLPNPNALGPTNLTNGTTTVVVPVSSDPSGEVQVHYVNKTLTATLKVCKVLTSTSGALAGKTFQFDILSRSVTDVDSLPVIATPGPNGACKVFFAQLPVGSSATVTEEGMPYVQANGQPTGTGATQTITIQPGINTVTFTNQAMGQLEICKTIAAVQGDPSYNITFHFSLDGSATDIPVQAGYCSPPQIVPAGPHTINETPIPYGFQFVSSTATGPTGDNRVISGANPVTVSVPYFFDATNGGETLVTFTNKVQRFQLKICKLIEPGSEDAIGHMTYFFDVIANYVILGASYPVNPPFPGPASCTGLLLNLPIVNASGAPATITVREDVQGGGFHVSAASVDNFKPGTTPVVTLGNGGGIKFNPGVGVDVVTITNAFGNLFPPP
jgi:hypothetical protein